MPSFVIRFCILASAFFTLTVNSAPSGPSKTLQTRGSHESSDKLVFCHFMMGVIADRTSASDYDADMSAAKDAGIDAFALNIGVDPFTDEQLGYAYDSASKNGMSVFISFDFNWWTTSQASEVGAKIAKYASQDAQLKIDGKVFVSSFSGDGLDLGAASSAAGQPLFWAPNFQPGSIGSADALLNWMAWPNNGNNKAPSAGNNVTVSQGDSAYTNALGGKPYIAPVSPWFSTHYGLEVSYSKNWVFPSDLLWYDRWTEILALSPQYIEILTWNDYGESHFVGPLSSPHVDDGNSKWTNDMPHDGWLTMARPYISAFKSGAKTISVTEDQLTYWYRPSLKSASCDSTDTCEKPWPSPSPNPNYFTGPPNGHETVADAVFVVALLNSPGTVTITSGSNTQSFSASAGANAFQLPLGTGKQSFSLKRGGSTILSGDSLKEVSADCICGIYNYNAYVGTLPAGKPDALQSDGLKSFAAGLSATCQPKPSLGTAPAGNGGSGPAQQTAASSAPSSSAAAAQVSSAPSAGTTTSPPAPAVTSAPATTTTAAAAGGGSGDGCVMTALNQFGSANCMPKGCTWNGPAGSDAAAPCDG